MPSLTINNDQNNERNNDRFFPPNVLEQIFQNIYGFRGHYRDAASIGTIYNCLLVCRNWCRCAVPILWSDTFYPIQTIKSEVISTYMLCLEDENLREIERAGIRLDKAGIIVDSENDSIEWGRFENLEMLRLEQEKLERIKQEESEKTRLEKNSETQKRLDRLKRLKLFERIRKFEKFDFNHNKINIDDIDDIDSFIKDENENSVEILRKPMFDYPIYLKELNFDKLLKMIFVWCYKYRGPIKPNLNDTTFDNSQRKKSAFPELDNFPGLTLFDTSFGDQLSESNKISPQTNSITSTNSTQSTPTNSNNKHELVLKSLLRLFANKRAPISHFSMSNVPTLLLNDNYFENLRAINFGTVLMDTGMRPLFEGIRHMNLEWDALTLDGFLYALGNVCKNLDSLSTNFAHDPETASLFLNKQQATDLAIFICSQTRLSSFILQNYQYFTNYFLESLNTQINSLKRLEFYAVDFEGCSLEVMASCKQLEYLSIIECMNITFDMCVPLFYTKFSRLKRVEAMDCSRFIEKKVLYEEDNFDILQEIKNDDTESDDDEYFRIDSLSMPSIRNGGKSEPTFELALRKNPSMEYHTSKTSTILLKPSSSRDKYIYTKFDREIPASTKHHILLHCTDPNFTTLPTELLSWAHSKNHPVPWYHFDLSLSNILSYFTFENIRDFFKMLYYTILFLIALYFFVPFFVGIANIVGQYIKWKIETWIGVKIDWGGGGSCGIGRCCGAGNMDII
ncbi:E3 ubiquitin-protein ligase RAD18 [Gigaspora margarita]|uniref:E3 ubiquitin-protein ligase RAD18 n=1 Tax=Gigaspora margarita TaxID=4874 RepID=A0A8H4ASP9_GIGMA|nr:E3 ubiquitin-protein ligase RAD18 [Gigaspora margarita]